MKDMDRCIAGERLRNWSYSTRILHFDAKMIIAEKDEWEVSVSRVLLLIFKEHG